MSDRRTTPAGSAATMLALPLVILVMAVASTIGGMLVVPLGDMTPIAVLLFSRVARRWAGAYSRLFDAAAILSVLMIVEWMLAYGASAYALTLGSPGMRERIVAILGFAWLLYVLELLVLLVTFGLACALSHRRIVRLERSADRLDGHSLPAVADG